MQTIRQAFILLRQNPLLSTIFILGTAFAITMIMAIVITWQMKYADIEPEVNRSRSLYISKMHLQGKENKGWNNYTACSPAFMKDCVQPLPEVEACTAFVPATVALVSMPDGTNAVKVDAMETDPGFWKVFRMQFVAGRGFDDSDRGGDVSAIVVAASVARKLFGTTDAVGKTVLLNRNEARICGVVKDVSVIAKDAYAQVWRMYPASLQDVTSVRSYAQSHTVVALARSSGERLLSWYFCIIVFPLLVIFQFPAVPPFNLHIIAVKKDGKPNVVGIARILLRQIGKQRPIRRRFLHVRIKESVVKRTIMRVVVIRCIRHPAVGTGNVQVLFVRNLEYRRNLAVKARFCLVTNMRVALYRIRTVPCISHGCL